MGQDRVIFVLYIGTKGQKLSKLLMFIPVANIRPERMGVWHQQMQYFPTYWTTALFTQSCDWFWFSQGGLLFACWIILPSERMLTETPWGQVLLYSCSLESVLRGCTKLVAVRGLWKTAEWEIGLDGDQHLWLYKLINDLHSGEPGRWVESSSYSAHRPLQSCYCPGVGHGVLISTNPPNGLG
jgi:hypothetical protein